MTAETPKKRTKGHSIGQYKEEDVAILLEAAEELGFHLTTGKRAYTLDRFGHYIRTVEARDGKLWVFTHHHGVEHGPLWERYEELKATDDT